MDAEFNREVPAGLHRLTRAEYDEMIRRGCFEDKRIELIYGLLVDMSPIGSGHVEVVKRLSKRLTIALGDRADVTAQGALAVSDDSELEPDLMVVPVADYSHALPSRAYLLIEVAGTSLARDRTIKARLYADAGVPEYSIVDINGRSVHVHREPSGGTYCLITTHAPEETIAIQAFPDVAVKVGDVLPTL